MQVVSTAGIGSTLSGVKSLGSDGQGFCAVLTSPSGAVDCWGDGYYGLLGNGDADIPVQVFGVAGTGTLSGVRQVVDNPTQPPTSRCAVLTTKGVDCWVTPRRDKSATVRTRVCAKAGTIAPHPSFRLR